jgi:hypothetical protein
VSLFAPNTDKNQTGFDFFFGAGASMSTLMTMNSARAGIESRSNEIANEIAYDRARGLDVTQSLEAMVNLSENLGVLDSNMAGAGIAGAVSFAPDFASQAAAGVAEIADELEVEVVTVPQGEESEQPGFAVAGAFEGSITEQVAQAAAEQDPEDMSIAAQIAQGAQAAYAESIDIMNDGGVDASTVAATDEVM